MQFTCPSTSPQLWQVHSWANKRPVPTSPRRWVAATRCVGPASGSVASQGLTEPYSENLSKCIPAIPCRNSGMYRGSCVGSRQRGAERRASLDLRADRREGLIRQSFRTVGKDRETPVRQKTFSRAIRKGCPVIKNTTSLKQTYY